MEDFHGCHYSQTRCSQSLQTSIIPSYWYFDWQFVWAVCSLPNNLFMSVANFLCQFVSAFLFVVSKILLLFKLQKVGVHIIEVEFVWNFTSFRPSGLSMTERGVHIMELVFPVIIEVSAFWSYP